MKKELVRLVYAKGVRDAINDLQVARRLNVWSVSNVGMVYNDKGEQVRIEPKHQFYAMDDLVVILQPIELLTVTVCLRSYYAEPASLLSTN